VAPQYPWFLTTSPLQSAAEAVSSDSASETNAPLETFPRTKVRHPLICFHDDLCVQRSWEAGVVAHAARSLDTTAPEPSWYALLKKWHTLMPNKRFVTPQLADLRQDIAGLIPLNVIHDWMQSPKNSSAHMEILSSFRRPGVVISSDSAGLTKMGSELPLLDVMKMVNDPKEILHSFGAAIGGTAVGLWVADNTEMFYDQSIEPREIMEQMIAAQREIALLPVQVGMAIHSGEFMLIGRGAFGPDADLVEALAEDHSCPAEILVTSDFRTLLEACAFPDLGFARKGETGAFTCDYGASLARGTSGTNNKYPFPFTEQFFTFLQEYVGPDSEEARRMLERYGREAVVVFLKVRHTGCSLLLDELTQWVFANAIIEQVTREHRVEAVKSNGSLGIFLADTAEMALNFAYDLRTALRGNGYDLNIGLAAGEVLVFPIDDSDQQNEIAGHPVNLASKLSEDVAERGAIYIDDSAARQLKRIPDAAPFHLTISRVEITGVKLSASQRSAAGHG
jgi:class 3 adenylate cyclase